MESNPAVSSNEGLRKRCLLLALLIAGAVFVVFSPVLSNGFVNWDDDVNFLNNSAWRGLGPENLKWMFTTFHLGHYIPLSWLSLGADYAVWGMNPFGYHLTSLLLHAANAVLFFFCLTFLLEAATAERDPAERQWAAFIGALFFALHPLRVESIAWVTARRDLVSGFFALSSAICYLRYVREGARAVYLAALALFACAVLGRESAAALPLVFLVLDVYPLRRITAGSWKRVLLEKLPFLAISAVAAFLAVLATRSIVCLPGLSETGFSSRLGLAAYSFAFYLWKTAVPLTFSHIYAIPAGFGIFSPAALASAALIAVLVAGAWRLRHIYPAVPAALSAYALFILPAGGVAATISLAYDRFSYLSCLGLAALFSGLWLTANKTWGRRQAALLFSALLLLAGARSFAQTFVWRDAASLWTNAIKHSGGHFRAQALAARGKVYLEQGQLDLASADFEHAISIKLIDGAVLGLAQAQMLSGRPDEAGKILDFMLQNRILPADALQMKGVLAFRGGDLKSATHYFDEALSLSPEDCRICNNRGLALEKSGDLAGASRDYSRAMALCPGHAQAAQGLSRVAATSSYIP
ncbi:MAG: hypothetical protein GX410_07410 [Elusimicrobia bacterium]|nr:hypothetical protein [Elusimicrobiota bacterium]